MPSAALLRRRLDDVRADPSASRIRRAAAWERWFAQARREGQEPDALSRRARSEPERFWAYTIPGMDGHTYWDGGGVFRRNDGRVRAPKRWVWEREHGPLPQTTDVWTTCGEKRCVALPHLAAGRSDARLRYRGDELLGFIQVAALRLGHTPTSRWWRAQRGLPSQDIYTRRWGSWDLALRSAGLEPHGRPRKYSEQTIREGVLALADLLGRRPSRGDYNREREWLRERGYPTDPKTVRGSLANGRPWPEVLRECGL